MRIDELSVQKEASKCAVNQLMVQIQELQDKVNPLNDAKEFYDPETAGNSGVIPRSQLTNEYSESTWID